MSLDNIYNLLQLWFCAWLMFQALRIISADVNKISALIRGRSDKRNG
jgi:hypothetical protein|nr:MAG TPA: hypothetical protein [Inoviridae sp.]